MTKKRAKILVCVGVVLTFIVVAWSVDSHNYDKEMERDALL